MSINTINKNNDSSFNNNPDFIVKEVYEAISDEKYKSIPSEERDINNLLKDLLISLPEGQKLEYLRNVNSKEDMLHNARIQLEKLNQRCNNDPSWVFTDTEWNSFCKEKLDNARLDNKERSQIVHQNNIQEIFNSKEEPKTIVIFDKKNLENNIVQVAQEVHLDDSSSTSRRADLVIFVNGLPLVIIELKTPGSSLKKEAYPQACNYTRPIEGYTFNSLFRYVQLLVISNGHHSRYFANSISSSNNKPDFYYGYSNKWTDATNNTVGNLFEFAQAFLNKRTILEVIFKYTVLTGLGKANREQSLKVLRPYQIAASERIVQQIKSNYNKPSFIVDKDHKSYNQEVGGYIWHTTGSGKTLTSFITTKLIAELEEPYCIDKVLFVLDRKDLDAQTQYEFSNIDNTSIGTKNIKQLREALLGNKGKKIIITTIQKLNSVLDDEEVQNANMNSRIVLIFDECHRSQFGSIQQKIATGRLFNKIYQFGFTGTPIFLENSDPSFYKKYLEAKSNDSNITYEQFNDDFAKQHPHILKGTTQGIFGDCLHFYVIKNAIEDNNVLGFKVKYIKWRKGKIKDSSLIKPEEVVKSQQLNPASTPDKLAAEVFIDNDSETDNLEFTKAKASHSLAFNTPSYEENHKFMDNLNLGFDVSPIKKAATKSSFFDESKPQHAFAIKKSKPLFSTKSTKSFVSLDSERNNHQSQEEVKKDQLVSRQEAYQETENSYNPQAVEDAQLSSKDPKRIEGIAQYILHNFEDDCKQRVLAEKYNALLAVEDIESAILYYNAFKKLQQHTSNKLRITTIFSTTHQDKYKDFEEDTGNTTKEDNYKFLESVIKEYPNGEVGDKSIFSNIVGEDIKTCKLDLVIVVGMLLTGFDAPCLRTIYVDKELSYHNLVQAFSRTNRIYKNKDKGLIVCFRDLEEQIERSISLFSNNANIEDFVTVEYNFDDYFFGQEGSDNCYINNYRKFIEFYQIHQEDLKSESWNDYTEVKRKFISLFNKSMQFIYKLRIYEQFDQLKKLEKAFANHHFNYHDAESYQNGLLLEVIKKEYSNQGLSFINSDYLDLILQKYLRAKYEIPAGFCIDITEFHDDRGISIASLIQSIKDQIPKKDTPDEGEILAETENLDFFESGNVNIDLEYLKKLNKKDIPKALETLDSSDPKVKIIKEISTSPTTKFDDALNQELKKQLKEGEVQFKKKLEESGYLYNKALYQLFLQRALKSSDLQHKDYKPSPSPFFNIGSQVNVDKEAFLKDLNKEFKHYLEYATML